MTKIKVVDLDDFYSFDVGWRGPEPWAGRRLPSPPPVAATAALVHAQGAMTPAMTPQLPSSGLGRRGGGWSRAHVFVGDEHAPGF